MWSIKRLLIIYLILVGHLATAQDCPITINGLVSDSGTHLPLEYVNIYIREIERGTATDSLGRFEIRGLCPGEYHLVMSHIGCESKTRFVEVTTDMNLDLEMDHSDHILHDVVIHDDRSQRDIVHVESISNMEISDNADESLSNLLEGIAGVGALKTGAGISKPIIHGLYGNRVTILNNGIIQSGQQWGNDHSPEIDALSANSIKVIKGSSALEYMGASLGSIILIEPSRITTEPHLHGKASYFYQTNGRGHGLNLQLQQKINETGWRINGTLKHNGDKSTPSYFLRNTGTSEGNLTFQLERNLSPSTKLDIYASTFNAEIGVLRGAHIGNVTDLETALTQSQPFFTEDYYIDSIGAPRQTVGHHLLKLKANHFFNDDQWMTLTTSMQINDRKEFDVRRGNRSDIPALSILQYAYFSEAKYNQNIDTNIKWSSGLQLNIIDNTNQPNTGIAPLIPDYFSYQGGAFTTFLKQGDHSTTQVGLRYDLVAQNVVTFTKSVPKEIVRYNNIYHNLSANIGYKIQLGHEYSLSTNLALGSRNPAVNELYSSGLHQGVSGIEEGQIDLESEVAGKLSIGFLGHLAERLSFEALAYYQRFDNYIFLAPQDEIRLTIRGAFPVFEYEQTDAHIYGADLSASLEISPSVSLQADYSYIRADDLSNDAPLVFIPAPNFRSALNYEYPAKIQVGNHSMENVALSLDYLHVNEQTHWQQGQDIIAPPTAYDLFDLSLAADLQLPKTRLRFTVKVSNLFDTTYRNYLNRQRYFADEVGRNIVFGISSKF